MKFKPGSTIVKIIIVKDDNLYDEGRGMQCEMTLYFSNNSNISEIINCELDDDKYSRGIYQYDGENYKQIENWDK